MEIEPILRAILAEYELPWFGIHGVTHWGRVLENGLRLAESTGANEDVVTLFALFHDSRRVNEDTDPGHGLRGAEFAETLRGSLFELPDADFHLLKDACARHTAGLTEGDITVQTCWDADRLDLGHVGVKPRIGKLCTTAAKEMGPTLWATERAEAERVPDSMSEIWRSLSGGREDV
jgi:uncharacterized protein